MRKIKALIQWFIALDVQEHWHTCSYPNGYDNCPNNLCGWDGCKGVTCVRQQIKPCPVCRSNLKLAATVDKVRV